MYVGLDLKKEGRTFLKTRNWTDTTRRDEYMSEIAAFLKKCISLYSIVILTLGSDTKS
ncbi:MAG: hypothetical protein ACFFAN_13230 [Promethearchaeota archaeon]